MTGPLMAVVAPAPACPPFVAETRLGWALGVGGWGCNAHATYTVHCALYTVHCALYTVQPSGAGGGVAGQAFPLVRFTPRTWGGELEIGGGGSAFRFPKSSTGPGAAHRITCGGCWVGQRPSGPSWIGVFPAAEHRSRN